MNAPHLLSEALTCQISLSNPLLSLILQTLDGSDAQPFYHQVMEHFPIQENTSGSICAFSPVSTRYSASGE